MKQSPDKSRVFDFDVGCLMKSPCRNCPKKGELPQCVTGCGLLDRIQTILSKGVSSTRVQTVYTLYRPSGEYPSVLD